MNQEQYGSRGFYERLSRMASLHARKSADYGDSEDPLANVRAGAELLGIPDWQACLVRIADKLQRIKSYIANGRLANEGIEDAIDDLASYAVIMGVLHEESNQCLKVTKTTTSKSANAKCCGDTLALRAMPSAGHTTAQKSSSTNACRVVEDSTRKSTSSCTSPTPTIAKTP